MSHGDQLSAIPEEFHVIGQTKTAPFAAIAHNSKPFYGIQFHPEVTHSPRGREVIGRFVLNICGCKPSWTMVRIVLFHTFLNLQPTNNACFYRKSSLVRKSPVFAPSVVKRVV